MQKRQVVILFGSLFYGILLWVAGVILSGMGEGPNTAMAVFGSPISATPFPLAVPAFWMLEGLFLAGGFPKTAGGWLILHWMVVPLAIRRHMTSPTWSAEWDGLMAVFRADPISSGSLFAIYIVGLIAAWVSVFRMHPRRSETTFLK